MLISDELLSGYEPREAMNIKNRKFELLLGRIGLFLQPFQGAMVSLQAPARKQDRSFFA